MALEFNSSSSWWYARIMQKGKLRRINLGIRIEGERPPSITCEGNPAFERSRGRAQQKHNEVVAEITSRRTAEELAQRVLEIKTGSRFESTKLADLPKAWLALPNDGRSDQHIQTMTGKLRRFVAFMRQHHPAVDELAGVRADQVKAFLSEEKALRVSDRTWNITFGLLKGVFRKLEPGADAYRSYFALQRRIKQTDTVHRKSFQPDEIKGLLQAAEADPLIRSLMIVAFCTAMRLGDCTRLRWNAVSLDKKFITVKTHKTGKVVDISVLPLLRAELQKQSRSRSPFVFPEAARIYEESRHQLHRRLQKVFARAGYVDAGTAERIKTNGAPTTPKPELPSIDPEEMRARGRAAIAKATMGAAKRQRMMAIFEAYLAGDALPQIARRLGVSKSTVSLHLNFLESAIGAALIRWRKQPMPTEVRGLIHAEPTDQPRLKRGSIMGWHSCRTTFVTLALSSGMPIALVQKVTGHGTVAIVLEHYFQPGRAQLAAAMTKAMPDLLTRGAKPKEDRIKAIIRRMGTATLQRDKERLMKLLEND